MCLKTLKSLQSRADSSVVEQQKKKKRTTRAGTDKCNKGMRYSSMKVMRKVEEKGKTTYNEVADELVREYTENKGYVIDQFKIR